MYYKRNSSGFTLLELLVVIVIIGLLAGYVAPRYFSQVGKSQIQTARAQIDALDKALDQYQLDTGHYPDASTGLEALVKRPATDDKWSGPYLKRGLPKDPWGHAYGYRNPGEHVDVDVFSYGPDGAQSDDDLGNW